MASMMPEGVSCINPAGTALLRANCFKAATDSACSLLIDMNVKNDDEEWRGVERSGERKEKHTTANTAIACSSEQAGEWRLVEGPPCLRASIIPGGWPLFWAKKQVNFQAPRLFYQRQSPTDRERIKHTIEMLKDSAENQWVGTICWFGTPGIAKSAALNEVLRHFIEHLGEPSFPPVVGLRINRIVVLWEWDAFSKTIRISEKKGESGPNTSLQAVSEIIRAKHGILLVEPEEHEPPFYFQCPTLIALSNRDAEDTLKFNSKCGGVDWLVVGTWTYDECKAAAWIEAMTKPNADWSAMASTIQTRFMKVGGLLDLF